MHQLFEERKAIHARHIDIKREHVGLQSKNLVTRDIRIGRRTHDFNIRIGRDHVRE
jgi:hypothetical protein